MAGVAFDPGALNVRLTLQRAVDVPDGQGGVVRSRVTVAPVWAKLDAVSAESVERAAQVGTVVTHRVTIRVRPDIATCMRFAKGERSFAIRTVQDPDESGRYLVCLCVEETP
ncbi:MAG: phage head closure protein [Pararhizobium sp.]